MNSLPVVLHVEDEWDDQFMLQRTLKKENVSLDLRIANHGDEAVEYLSGKGKFSDRAAYPLPALILMDIKMPRRSGLEVLKWMREDQYCKGIPVIMVSSSPLQADMNRAYELGVNAYLIKPLAYLQVAEMFRNSIDLFRHQPTHPH
jgi:CheY-like chemotaxis protein